MDEVTKEIWLVRCQVNMMVGPEQNNFDLVVLCRALDIIPKRNVANIRGLVLMCSIVF